MVVETNQGCSADLVRDFGAGLLCPKEGSGWLTSGNQLAGVV